MSKGWISVHRKIQQHWLWENNLPFDKRAAWIDILLMVNHKKNKILFDNNLIEIEPGERITSERKLADRWGWSRTKVRNFLELLEKDGMLKVEKTTKRTSLKVVNWGKYQKEKTGENTKEKPEGNQSSANGVPGEDTNNNDNNDNNENNEQQPEDVGQKKSEIPKIHYKTFSTMIKPLQLEKINAFIDDGLTEEMIIYAYEVAAENNASSLNYVQAILKKWREKNIKTLKEAKMANEEYKKSKTGSKSNKKQTMKELYAEGWR